MKIYIRFKTHMAHFHISLTHTQPPDYSLHGFSIVENFHIQIHIRFRYYFKQRNSVPVKTRHLVEFFFECTVPECYTPRNGHHPDKHQVAVVWKDITQLEQAGLFLQTLISCLDKSKQVDEPVYLGKFG